MDFYLLQNDSKRNILNNILFWYKEKEWKTGKTKESP